MARQNLAAPRQYRGDTLAGVGVQLTQLAGVPLPVCPVEIGPLRIGCHQGFDDVLDVGHPIGGTVPGMRIEHLLAILHLADRTDARRRDDLLTFEAGRCDQPGHPALEAQAVDEDNIGRLELSRVVGRRFECVRIAIRPDQACDMDPIAADLVHHVGQHGKARDGLDRSGWRGPCR